jgi:hypothetical protein
MSARDAAAEIEARALRPNIDGVLLRPGHPGVRLIYPGRAN